MTAVRRRLLQAGLPDKARRRVKKAAKEELPRTTGHSKILTKNLACAGEPKPEGEVDSHHIVAWKAKAAHRSRMLLFGWCIGINDCDNGVNLPANADSEVAELPTAIKHRPMHTPTYHANVLFVLRMAAPIDKYNGQIGRKALREIKVDIIDGIFPIHERIAQ